MKLVDRWKHVLKRSWSVRLMGLSILVMIAEPIYTWFAANWVAHNIYIQLAESVGGALLAVAAIAARVIFQKNLTDEENDDGK